MYGTNTPNSDLDYKSIYLPKIEDILVGNDKILNSINISNKENIHDKSDKNIIEEESFTLQKYLNLLCEGQTVAIDMLFSNYSSWEKYNSIWVELHSNRQKFITKKLKTFIYYCRNQANKYGFKGSRLNSAEKVFDFLKNKDPMSVLGEYKDALFELEDENIKVFPNENNIGAINVCGKTLIFSSKIGYNIDILAKFINNYGDRAKLAAQNIGVDYKACSHFLRACFEIQELIETKNIIFPLKDRKFLTLVKEGNIQYKDLEKIMEETLDYTVKMFIEADLPNETIFDKEKFILKVYGF